MTPASIDLVREFGGMPDERLDRRLRAMARALAADPSSSFPRAFGTVSAAEAGYRFLRNPRVSPRAIMGPHVAHTWARAKAARTVLAIEDTSEIRFRGLGTRDGLGPLMNDGQGFFLHAALLAETGAHPTPLGVAAYEVVVRDAADSRRKKALSRKRRLRDPHNEQLRWQRVASTVASAAAAHEVSVVHVADREADQYSLLSKLLELRQRFVIRLRFDRRTAETDEWISHLLSRAPTVLEREVSISSRVKLGDGRRKNKRPRAGREAKLSVRATTVTLRRQKGHLRTNLKEIQVNVVEVVELNPPAGEEAVQWMLLTTEPIATSDDLAVIVDMYRARWLIEEFWKALKTGCAYEDRQLESRRTLENALALFLPLAWNMLRLRAVARVTPDAPATAALSGTLLRLLHVVARTPNNRWGVRLPENPTSADVLRAVARMGGHLPQNGDPGWLVLRRGFDDLFALQAAAELLGSTIHGDQSDQ